MNETRFLHVIFHWDVIELYFEAVTAVEGSELSRDLLSTPFSAVTLPSRRKSRDVSIIDQQIPCAASDAGQIQVRDSPRHNGTLFYIQPLFSRLNPVLFE